MMEEKCAGPQCSRWEEKMLSSVVLVVERLVVLKIEI